MGLGEANGYLSTSAQAAVVSVSPLGQRRYVVSSAVPVTRRFQTPQPLQIQEIINRQLRPSEIMPGYTSVGSQRRKFGMVRQPYNSSNNNGVGGEGGFVKRERTATSDEGRNKLLLLEDSKFIQGRCKTELNEDQEQEQDDQFLPVGSAFHRLRSKQAGMLSKIKGREVAAAAVTTVTGQSTSTSKMKQRDTVTKIYTNDSAALSQQFDAVALMQSKKNMQHLPSASNSSFKNQVVVVVGASPKDVMQQKQVTTPHPPPPLRTIMIGSMNRQLSRDEQATQMRKNRSVTPYLSRHEGNLQQTTNYNDESLSLASIQFEQSLSKRYDRKNAFVSPQFPEVVKMNDSSKREDNSTYHMIHSAVTAKGQVERRLRLEDSLILPLTPCSNRSSVLRNRRVVPVLSQQQIQENNEHQLVKGNEPFSLRKNQNALLLLPKPAAAEDNSHRHNLSQPPFEKSPSKMKEMKVSLTAREVNQKEAEKVGRNDIRSIRLDAKTEYEMSDEEWKNFGNRFPKGFSKIKLLGRGGFAVVWLGQNKSTKEMVAIKQVLSANVHQTHLKEIWFAKQFFELGQPKKDIKPFRGLKNIIQLCGYSVEKVDTWLFYDLGGVSLGNNLYDIISEEVKQPLPQPGEAERVFRIIYKDLYKEMRVNPGIMKQLICELAHGIDLISSQGIVHSDLKTENILVKASADKLSGRFRRLEDVRLADYGSAFTFGDLKGFTMATPEYMAPEILNYILYVNKLKYDENLLGLLQNENYSRPFVIDMWSLGCVALELVNGIPLWMSLQAKLTDFRGKEIIRTGLFAVKNRVFDQIIAKQREVVENIDAVIEEKNYPGIAIDQPLRQAIKGMLQMNPAMRLSPQDVIKLLQPSLRNN